jgi:hypothetical protein
VNLRLLRATQRLSSCSQAVKISLRIKFRYECDKTHKETPSIISHWMKIHSTWDRIGLNILNWLLLFIANNFSAEDALLGVDHWIMAILLTRADHVVLLFPQPSPVRYPCMITVSKSSLTSIRGCLNLFNRRWYPVINPSTIPRRDQIFVSNFRFVTPLFSESLGLINSKSTHKEHMNIHTHGDVSTQST